MTTKNEFQDPRVENAKISFLKILHYHLTARRWRLWHGKKLENLKRIRERLGSKFRMYIRGKNTMKTNLKISINQHRVIVFSTNVLLWKNELRFLPRIVLVFVLCLFQLLYVILKLHIFKDSMQFISLFTVLVRVRLTLNILLFYNTEYYQWTYHWELQSTKVFYDRN